MHERGRMMSRLVLAGAAVAIAAPPSAHAQGRAELAAPPSGSAATRTLVCHGGPGIQVRVHADPSPSWKGPASYPTKPVQMALQFTGGASIARLADAANLPAGSCAWVDWDARFGAPPGEVYVDVNAGAAIHEALLELRARGTALLIVSEDLDELLALADRIAVLSRGRLSPVLSSAAADRGKIGEWMSGLLPDRVPSHAA